jgi:hypothetical protein
MATIVVETNVPIPITDGARLFADNVYQGPADLRR